MAHTGSTDRRLITKRLHGMRLVMTLALVFCLPAVANEQLDRCFEQASIRFGHKNPKVLRALAIQESSLRCTLRHPANKDGSYDIGCMGINSSWLPLLRTKFGITEQDLYQPCTNIHVGAWLYARNIRQFGDDWRAIGAYGAVSEQKRIEYAWKINSKLDALR